MTTRMTRRTLLGAGLAIPLAAGCGSGGAGAGGGGRGALTLTLNLQAARAATQPARSRTAGGFIPLGTKAVSVSVTDSAGALLAPTQLVTAPFTQQNQTPPIINVTFPNLPAGGVTVQASAFPDAAGQQPPIAAGSGSTTVPSGGTANLVVPVQLTLETLTVNPMQVGIAPGGGMANVTAQALDAQGRPLQYPLTWLSEDPGIASVSFNPANPTSATVNGVSEGSTNVTVIEPNSGTLASVTVFVGG
ncbi:MAG TPA: hypothetical protein VKT77_20890 [Chthonomonadaceae bacterium]|nr:hypothetical protein [Chthonomonadaceae bacterium]